MCRLRSLAAVFFVVTIGYQLCRRATDVARSVADT